MTTCLALGLAAVLAAGGLRFGDPASEAAGRLEAPLTTTADGALGQPCRRIEPGGALTFELACDPAAANYLTIRLWGGDREVGTLFLFDGEKRYGDYLGAFPELDQGRGDAAFPGRFYEVTQLLPAALTRDRPSVRLTLRAIGRINPYAPPGQRERPPTGPSRGLYGAWVHTDPWRPLVPGEVTGQAPAAQPTQPIAAAAALRDLRAAVDAAVERLLRWQVQGPEWEQAVARGDAPAAVLGAPVRPLAPSRKPAAQWLDDVQRRVSDGNTVSLNVLTIYGLAWAADWSRFHDRADLVRRVFAGLDYACRAQAASGALNTPKWCGGPRRQNGGSCLEGFGTAALGESLLAIWNAPERASLLAATVDQDHDPATPPVPRAVAYAALLRSHRDFLVSREGRGHATNQDLAQITAMWLANEALRRLAPTAAWPREQALRYVDAAVGLAPDPLGGVWVTRAGLALEPWGTLGGGYCGNYGLLGVGQIARLAELTGEPRIQERAVAASRAAAWFFTPSLADDGRPCLRREEVISTRNNNLPGRVDHAANPSVATALAEPLALRRLQYGLQHGHSWSLLEESNAHFVDHVVTTLRDLPHLAKLVDAPPTTARLPLEDDQPDAAWCDPEAGAVVVKQGATRLFVSLNWRRGFEPGGRDRAHARVSNLARIHCTTPTFDRIATLAMDSPQGFGGLYLCRYGRWWIALNSSPTAAAQATVPAAGRDLLTGRAVAADEPLALAPLGAVVADLGEG